MRHAGSGPPADAVDNVEVFTTRGLGSDSSVAEWEQFTSTSFIPLHAKVLDEGGLDASGMVAEVGAIRIMSLRIGPHLVEHPGALIGDTDPSTMLSYTLKGEVFVFVDGQTHLGGVDRLLVTELGRPFVSGFSEGVEALSVVVPNALLRRAIGRPTLPAPKAVDIGCNIAAAALRKRLVAATVDAAATLPGEDELLELIGGVFAPHTPVSNYLDRAREYIDANLADSGLTATRIARGVGISERHLSRIFGESGTSVPKYVREQRLLRSRQLMMRAGTEVTIETVAARCGFASIPHFTRLYGERFGVRADDVLRETAVRRALLDDRTRLSEQ